MPAPRVRTLLIDDSAFMRKVIGDIIRADDSLELVGIANDGRTGSEMALELKPDVVITDMVMPDYDGMFVVKSVMEKSPMPIILLSSLEKSNTRIFDALQQGAFEFIDKPTDMEMVRVGNYPLVNLILEASRTDISLLKAKQMARKNTSHHTFSSTLHYDIVAIGASTGGPGAVELIINNLPANLQVPVIIAQHMPARFLETFSVRLNERSPIPVKLAHRGDVVKPGTIYIANGESNTRIENNIVSGLPIITYSNRKYDEFNFPSVDCLFESVADVYGMRSIGVILTGMGKDGVKGMTQIHQKGGFTIAQDEESSVVYGMPKAAADQGIVNRVVKLSEIPGFIVSCL
jgi:two-component system chemotaxis response regulator CheB